MAKYKWNKYRKTLKKIVHGSIVSLDQWGSVVSLNRPGQMMTDVHFQDYASRLETTNETRIRHGHHAAGFTISGDTIDAREVIQAGIVIRPSLPVPRFADDVSSGIQPAFSNVYRRGSDSIQDTINRLSEFVVGGAERRDSITHFTAGHGRPSRRDDTERASGSSDHPSLAAEYLLNSIRNGDVPQSDPEEATTRH